MRIALAQVNPTVGALDANAARIREAVARAGAVDLVVFPELVLTGYPPLDLCDEPGFLLATEATEAALALALRDGPPVVLGSLRRTERGRPAQNVAVLLQGGHAAAVSPKALLPTYDVFDEARWFAPGAPQVLTLAGKRVGVSICEDLWIGPSAPERERHDTRVLSPLQGCDVVLNLSASPFERGKPLRRRRVMAEAAQSLGCDVVHVNLVGANDDLIFDGRSLWVDRHGALRAEAAAFREDVLVVDLAAPPADTREVGAEHDPLLAVYEALVLGIGDYVRKVGGRGVVLGLSGGIDSAVTAALAVKALGRERVVGLAMPSEFSSGHSVADAEALAHALGIALHHVPIQGPLAALRQALAPTLGEGPWGLADENLQARIRGQLLMAFSNKHGHLVLATGNKSELSVGYSTLYGDLCGAIAPIGDVWKTDVYALARLINAERPVIPESTLTKAPSAELRPDQTDQDSLPPYPALDAALAGLIERRESVDQVASSGVLPRAEVERVATLVRLAEYKRRQAPIVLRVSGKAFGPGRRLPVARA